MRFATEQTLRAGDIIRRLREFVARGDTEKHFESLSRLLEEAGALAMLGFGDSGVRLRYRLGATTDQVLVDKVQIQQVVLNLMRNAAEAMSGSPIKDLLVCAQDGEAGTVMVSVSDTGPGVGPDLAARLFDPFVTTKEAGMGVGLSISRTIIEAHGGRIWCDLQQEGRGATFRFTLRTAPPAGVI